MVRILIVGASVLLLPSCLSPEQKGYIDRTLKQPLAFRVDTSNSESTWARAQLFLARYLTFRMSLRRFLRI